MLAKTAFSKLITFTKRLKMFLFRTDYWKCICGLSDFSQHKLSYI